MLQNLLFLSTLGFAVTHTCFAQSCPPAFELAPCTCDEATLNWDCSGYGYPGFDPKAIFDRVSPLVDQKMIFNELSIRWFEGSELPPNTMTSLKFRKISLHTNFNLVSLHPDAFNETYAVTTELSVRNNELQNHNNASDNYAFFAKFKALEFLSMGNNHGMIYIPTDPFPEPLPNLNRWSLGIASIEILGSRIFANLPALRDADLARVDLSINEFAPDSFEGIGPEVVLNLEHNPFSRLPEDIFKPVLDGAAGLKVGGQDCEFTNCWNIELDCDEESAWLCEHQSLYQPKLSGFYCRKTSGYNTIWNWCTANRK